ncbi:hypothetical protein ACSCB1_15210 [Streptomyces europaeiscabiei]|uniref:hypothetical protein n=1 Tax=Streptomyces europaeiscabiei TaxID=146819 RepID=UPI000B1ECCA6|nr:hypothetical protein [Streptomyces europaeiscabiei]
MDSGVSVALVSGVTALAVSGVGVPLNYWLSVRTRRDQAQDIMGLYRDPLLWSVHDLRTRVATILYQDFLTHPLGEGETRVEYALRHTQFAFAEYFGWVEILRRSVGFLDLGDRRKNRKLVEHFAMIRRVFFAGGLGSAFQILYGEQRAIGELMISQDVGPEGRIWRCFGFAEFNTLLDQDERFAKWLSPIRESVHNFIDGSDTGLSRLIALKGQLDDLIEFLDPGGVRFPLRESEWHDFTP